MQHLFFCERFQSITPQRKYAPAQGESSSYFSAEEGLGDREHYLMFCILQATDKKV
jgi:hypothetical protein